MENDDKHLKVPTEIKRPLLTPDEISIILGGAGIATTAVLMTVAIIGGPITVPSEDQVGPSPRIELKTQEPMPSVAAAKVLFESR